MDKGSDERKSAFWRRAETLKNGDLAGDIAEVLGCLRFNEDGLLPVVARCANTGGVLMLAWMNKTALEQTLAEGFMVYYSRSRQTLWKKGETSGCLQRLRELRIDCDGDAILATVEQSGAGACHTLKPHCFYIRLDNDGARIVAD